MLAADTTCVKGAWSGFTYGDSWTLHNIHLKYFCCYFTIKMYCLDSEQIPNFPEAMIW